MSNRKISRAARAVLLIREYCITIVAAAKIVGISEHSVRMSKEYKLLKAERAEFLQKMTSKEISKCHG